MLDPQLIRNDLTGIAKALSKRGFELQTQEIDKLEDERKQTQVATQELQSKRNALSKEIGKLKSQGLDAKGVMEQVNGIADELSLSESKLTEIQNKLNEILFGIPNIPHSSVPEGKEEKDNIENRKWGDPKQFSFEIKDHVDLGQDLGMLDFESAVKITSSRFVVMKSGIAKLHRALIQFMIDTHVTNHGYTEVNVPYLVNADSLLGTGQLPKFEEDLFKINEQGFYLIPTAEVPVTNIVRDEILEEQLLPLKFVCHTPCFRSEAGSYGKDTRGMIRQHQFEKVELVQIVKPETSYDQLESLLNDAEVILQKLDLPYRVVTLCGGDLGFSSAKTYDIEVWLPAQNTYREISSCSNFESFQARRMKARYRSPGDKKPQLVHTLNGSGLAVGRTLVAILENYQNEDGSISIPEALQNYMQGQTVIE